MGKFQINQDITYSASSIVKNNVFIDAVAEDEEVPKYEKVMKFLPQPIWRGRDDVISCYNFAWKTAFRNIKKANASANFISNYIDTAFNRHLFMWDSAFIVAFGKYASQVFNFQKTLDNFYSHQHKDGFICREICEEEPTEQFSRHDPSSTGPNVLGWAEWEYYCQSGDASRLEKVYNPLLAYHLWLKENRTWRDGSYWATGWACGMDNLPRLEQGYHVSFSNGHMVWVDACIQQVISAKVLVKVAEIIGRDKDEEVSMLKDEIESLTHTINENLWSEDDGFYYDLYKNGNHSKVKTIASYWALLAEIVPKNKLEKFISHLQNENEFNRIGGIPALSGDHPLFKPDGGYWCGGVWAPTNYMVLKGLEKNGYNSLAHRFAKKCLENVVSVFKNDATIYENYSPDSFNKGGVAKLDFVGWSGLFPISILFEYVFGILSVASEDKIVWNVNLLSEHGIKNYPFNGLSVDLICKERVSESDEPIITAICSKRVKIEVRYANKTKTIYATTN